MRYSSIEDNFITEFKLLVEEAGSILITSQKCDDDGVASVLSMYYYLAETYPKKKLKAVILHYPNLKWHYLKNFPDIEFITDFRKYSQHFPLIIFLDYSNYHYWNVAQGDKYLSSSKTIAIDHHSTPPDDFDLSLVVPDATSTTELILNSFYKDRSTISSDLAAIALTGILGDTGILKYITPNNAKIYSLVETLVTDHAINLGQFLSSWKECSRKQFRIIQEFIRTMRVEQFGSWPTGTISFINLKTKNTHQYTDLDLDEASGYYISQFGTFVEDTQWGIVLYPESQGTVRIKVRSRTPKVNVRSIMTSLKIGGGHAQAGGGVFAHDGVSLDAEECLEILTQWLSTHRYDRVLEVCEEVPS